MMTGTEIIQVARHLDGRAWAPGASQAQKRAAFQAVQTLIRAAEAGDALALALLRAEALPVARILVHVVDDAIELMQAAELRADQGAVLVAAGPCRAWWCRLRCWWRR